MSAMNGNSSIPVTGQRSSPPAQALCGISRSTPFPPRLRGLAGVEMRVTGMAKAPEVAGGISMRARRTTATSRRPLAMRILVRRAAYRHPGLWWRVPHRRPVGVVLGVILCSYGFWWGALVIAVGALELWVAYHLLLAPLPRRVRELEQTRAHAVDDSAAKLRQIERDLHDGAQAQMVAVTMKLGLAMKKLGRMVNGTGQTDLDRVLDLVAAAHRGAKEAVTEMRDLARGIHHRYSTTASAPRSPLSPHGATCRSSSSWTCPIGPRPR